MLCYCRFLFFYFFIFQVPGSGSRIRIHHTDPDPKHCPGLFPYRLTLGDEVTLPFDTSQFRQSMQLRAISKSAVFSIICFITYLWLVWFWVKIVKIRLIYRLLAGSMYLPLHLVTLILKKNCDTLSYLRSDSPKGPRQTSARGATSWPARRAAFT